MLEDQFDFVLLAEFFDESLVILAKRFCWDLEQANYSDFLWEKTRSGRGYWFSPWKEPGVAQVRYLKQNSRRKDAVSKMTLETRETLEVNINFATLQCFFVQEWLAIDYKLYNHFLQVFEGEILRWEKAWASILQLWKGSSCKRCGPAATDEQAAWKRLCSCQYQQFRAE